MRKRLEIYPLSFSSTREVRIADLSGRYRESPRYSGNDTPEARPARQRGIDVAARLSLGS